MESIKKPQKMSLMLTFMEPSSGPPASALARDGRRVGVFPHDGEWLAIDRMEQLEDAARIVAEKHA